MLLLTVQQPVHLSDAVDMCGGDHQLRGGIDTDVRLHAEVVLTALGSGESPGRGACCDSLVEGREAMTTASTALPSCNSKLALG